MKYIIYIVLVICWAYLCFGLGFPLLYCGSLWASGWLSEVNSSFRVCFGDSYNVFGYIFSSW